MVVLFRFALQVLFFLLPSSVVGLASPQTGVTEKALLLGLAGVLIWLASLVRGIGARSVSRST